MGSFSLIHSLILLLPVIAAGLLALLLSRRRGRRDDLGVPPRPAQPAAIVPPAPPAASVQAPVTLPPDVEMKVWVELRDGNVINAVKLVRDATGLHLKEAQEMVDELRRRDPQLR
ncbi:ribosomal protein L7/L12 [Sphingomonas sp. DT-204]|uniref:ribosomal protein L7/L12 n=1 Tax=Sphingomonas sp. DT-204 TaxID=3396166 RepID=UPI003F1AC67E